MTKGKTFSLFAVFIIENRLILGLRCLVAHFIHVSNSDFVSDFILGTSQTVMSKEQV